LAAESRAWWAAAPAIVGWLIVVSLGSLYLLTAQAGSSLLTYLLALAVLVAVRHWWPIVRAGWPLLLLSGGLLLYLTVSALWSPEFVPRRVQSTATAALLTLLFVIGVAFAAAAWSRFDLWLARMVSVVAGLGCAGALFVYVQAPPPDGRLLGMGQITNSVVAAQMYGAAVLFSLHVLAHDGRRWRAVAVFALLCQIAALAFTGSRSAQLATLLAGGAYLLSGTEFGVRRYLTRLTALAVAMTLALILLLLVLPPAQDVLFPRGDSLRLATWATHWQQLTSDGLWLGRGIHAERTVQIGEHDILHPHNIFLSAMVQGGLVAGALLLTLVGLAARALLQSRQQPMAVLGFALLLLWVGAYLFDGWHLIDKVSRIWLLLWLPVGIALAQTDRSAHEATTRLCRPAPRHRSMLRST
jgi:O-antigen ligase